MLKEIIKSELDYGSKKAVIEAYQVIYESTVSNTLMLIGLLASLLYSKESKESAIDKASQSIYAMLEKTYNTNEQAKADSTVMGILEDLDGKYGKGTSIEIMKRANDILDSKVEAKKSTNNSQPKKSDYQPTLQQAKLSVSGYAGSKMLFIGVFDESGKLIKEFAGDKGYNEAKKFIGDKNYKIMYKIEKAKE